MEIVLLRHGKPEIELKGNVNATGFKQLVVKYEQSGIQDLPPNNLKNRFEGHYVVCSNLERSLQSAKVLGFKQIHLTESLFAETSIPHFDQTLFKVPVMIWLIGLRIMWIFGFNKNGESFLQAKKRSKLAAEKLVLLAQENEKIIVVGHGLINILIGRQLQINGWNRKRAKGKKYWKFISYTIN